MKILLILFTFAASVSLGDVCKIAVVSSGKTEAYICAGEDSDSRYYRGVRFDPTGVVLALKTNGKTYFGNRHSVHKPDWHDSISGPVEEYGNIGYDSASVGEGFLKIGVGILEKISDGPYNFRVNYPIKNAGERSVKVGKDSVEYIHRLLDKSGYGYILKKTLRVEESKLVVEHELSNTGRLVIDTSMYTHCFFAVNNASVDETILVKYSFDLNCSGDTLGKFAKINGKQIEFLKPLFGEDRAYINSIIPSDASAENSVSVEFGNVGAGVSVKSDVPMLKSIFWSCYNSVCPEPFVKIFVKPNEKFLWKFEYEFYNLKK